MPNFRITITIVREFTNRANAISACDAIIAKVPVEWTVQTEKCEKV